MLTIVEPDQIKKKTLDIPFFETHLATDNKLLDRFLDALPKQQLAASNWRSLKNIPKASFSVAYNEGSLFVKYYVCETDIKADYTNTHDPVSEDSCVELFISFDDNECYYNLEFNTLGTCLAAYGRNRSDRQKLDVNVVREIRHWLNWITYAPNEDTYEWTLTLSIPLTVFYHNDMRNMPGKTARANVYKCGEKLKEPHYLMWSDIQTDQPDFHQPDFFGEFFFKR